MKADAINSALVLAHARAWIGTPWVRRAALRGVGADCIGLVRGVFRDLTGRDIPAPMWRNDWALGGGDPISDGLRRHAVPVPPTEARPGHVVTFRVGAARAAHVGILTEAGVIHAAETGGVQESMGGLGRRITSAWALPCHPDCTTGGATTATECLAVIYPLPDGRAYAEISDMWDATPLALTAAFPSRAEALAYLDPIYPNIETME